MELATYYLSFLGRRKISVCFAAQSDITTKHLVIEVTKFSTRMAGLPWPESGRYPPAIPASSTTVVPSAAMNGATMKQKRRDVHLRRQPPRTNIQRPVPAAWVVTPRFCSAGRGSSAHRSAP